MVCNCQNISITFIEVSSQYFRLWSEKSLYKEEALIWTEEYTTQLNETLK